MCDALDAAGLENFRIGLGDVMLYPSLLRSLGVDGERSERILALLAAGDFVGVDVEIADAQLASGDAELLLAVPGPVAVPTCSSSSTARSARRVRGCAPSMRCWRRDGPSG